MMSSPKVLILTSSFLPTIGGIQFELKWFLDSLDRHLEEKGDIQAHFVYPNQDSEQYSCFENIATHDLGHYNRRRSSVVSMVIRLGKILRRIRPDVVHCHAVLPDGMWILLAARLFGVRTKVIVTSHGQDIVWLPDVPYGIRGSEKSKRLIRYVIRRIAAHVLVSSAMVQHAIDAGAPMERIRVIPNGIPIGDEYNFEEDDRFDLSAPNHGDLVARKGDGINILSLSSGRAMKNLDFLIEAFSLVRHEVGDSRLLLACVGPLAERIARLVQEKGLSQQVTFIGEVRGSTKHSYFRASDVYCLPSHFEPFGIVALEAMKYDAAVLASRCGGTSDFVNDGINGLLVSPRNVDEIASALVRLYKDTDLRNRLIENGQETVKRFSISRIVDEYIDLYRQVVG